jgi:CubicO group peptidase (beta-lactamase class C family)
VGELRKWFWCVVVAAIGLAVLGAPAGARLPGSRTGQDLGAVDGFVRSQMERHRIPGLALAITEGGEVVHLRGFGTAENERPVTPETPFFIGSVSKSFTALAVMQLVEAGDVELDAPVRRYIPWFAVAEDQASASITVRHLLHQISGLSEAGYRRGVVPPETTLEQTVRELQQASPTEPVGTKYQYFNLNYNVLGLIVQEVSGQPYGAYLEEHIFAPLGMENTYVSREAAEEAGLAHGHNVVLGFPVLREQPYLPYDLPAGMIISSAADMGRYIAAQNNGGCIDGTCVLSPEGVEMMHTRPAAVDSPYAMGWQVHEEDGLRVVRHNGAVRTFFSSAVLLPQRDIGIVVLVNQNGLFHLLVAYERVVEGVVDLLVGRELVEGISMALLYAVISAIIAVDLAVQGWRLVRLPPWRRWWEHHGSRRALVVPVVRAVVALLVLVGLPALLITQAGTDATRVMLFNYMPGIAAWLAVSAVLTLVEVGSKIRWVVTTEPPSP